MKRAIVDKSVRYLKTVSPSTFSKLQSITTDAGPEQFVRDALWRIAHPNGRLIGQDQRDIDNIYQFLSFAAPRVHQASGQFFQDLWARWETDDARGGYFVEFGATDGKTFSNTYSLEKDMGWNGVVAEPHPSFSSELASNRSCFVSTQCVHTHSGQTIDFAAIEGSETYSHAVVAGREVDKRAKVIKVPSISLNDLLTEAKAPRFIDFMSVDTEGSEFDILSHFDFKKWRVQCVAIEHNHTDSREKLYRLMTRNGYRRKWPGLGHVDDWYVLD